MGCGCNDQTNRYKGDGPQQERPGRQTQQAPVPTGLPKVWQGGRRPNGPRPK